MKLHVNEKDAYGFSFGTLRELKNKINKHNNNNVWKGLCLRHFQLKIKNHADTKKNMLIQNTCWYQTKPCWNQTKPGWNRTSFRLNPTHVFLTCILRIFVLLNYVGGVHHNDHVAFWSYRWYASHRMRTCRIGFNSLARVGASESYFRSTCVTLAFQTLLSSTFDLLYPSIDVFLNICCSSLVRLWFDHVRTCYIKWRSEFKRTRHTFTPVVNHITPYVHQYKFQQLRQFSMFRKQKS